MGDLTLTLRPRVPMGHVVGVPFVCALGAAKALGARVAWPHDVADSEGAPLVRVRTRAGYDDGGVCVTCGLSGERADVPGLGEAVCACVDAWAAEVAAGRAAAGPLAPVLPDYFDALLGMGGAVEVVRAGRVVACGELAGVDAWGRATVRLADGGSELEVAAEQAELRVVE